MKSRNEWLSSKCTPKKSKKFPSWKTRSTTSRKSTLRRNWRWKAFPKSWKTPWTSTDGENSSASTQRTMSLSQRRRHCWRGWSPRRKRSSRRRISPMKRTPSWTSSELPWSASLLLKRPEWSRLLRTLCSRKTSKWWLCKKTCPCIKTKSTSTKPKSKEWRAS